MPDLNSPSNDRLLALKTAAWNLETEFAGTSAVQTIEQFLATSYDQFVDRPAITNFLLLMAERSRAPAPQALACVEGKANDGLRTVLSPAPQRRPLADGPGHDVRLKPRRPPPQSRRT